MTANPFTDQIAASVAAKLPPDRAIGHNAAIVADGLSAHLPDIASEVIGEVAMHLASCLGAMVIEADRRHRSKPDPYVVNLLNVLAIAGHKLYTGGGK